MPPQIQLLRANPHKRAASQIEMGGAAIYEQNEHEDTLKSRKSSSRVHYASNVSGYPTVQSGGAQITEPVLQTKGRRQPSLTNVNNVSLGDSSNLEPMNIFNHPLSSMISSNMSTKRKLVLPQQLPSSTKRPASSGFSTRSTIIMPLRSEPK